MKKRTWLAVPGILTIAALPVMALEVAHLQHDGHPQADLWVQLPDGRLLRATQPFLEDVPLWLEHRQHRVVLHAEGAAAPGIYQLGVSRWFDRQPMVYQLQLNDGQIFHDVVSGEALVNWQLSLTAAELSAGHHPRWLRPETPGHWQFGGHEGEGILSNVGNTLQLSWTDDHTRKCTSHVFAAADEMPAPMRQEPHLQLHRSLLLDVLEPERIALLPDWLPLQAVPAATVQHCESLDEAF